MCNIGDLAICKHGRLGLITKIIDGPKGKVYKGVNLSDEKYGRMWNSKEPKFVVNLKELMSKNKDTLLNNGCCKNQIQEVNLELLENTI